jgi:PAS domain S-box-containing protein
MSTSDDAAVGREVVPELGSDAGPNDRYRWLLDSAPDAMILVDGRGSIMFVNQQTERLFGFRRAELLGASFEVLVPERLRRVHRGHVERFFSHPASRSMGLGLEVSAVRADGSEVPVEISLSPHQTAEGTFVSAAIRDVSRRRELEAKAKLNADRLASAVAAIEDAFAVFDSTDRLVLCNRQYEELFTGAAAGSLIGRSSDALLALWLPGLVFRTDEERENFVVERRAQSADRNASFDLTTVDGRWLRVQDRSTEGEGRVRTVWDLTGEQRKAEELEKARAEADAANTAKSEFLSSMSHELRTPLNAILGFAQLMQRDRKEPLSEAHRKRLAQILQGGEHLLRLIDDVLDLARIEAGGLTISVEPVDPLEALREVIVTLEPSATRANVRLELEEAPAEVPSVSVDRTRFAQILMNFGSNAVKYNRAGGHVTFSISALNDVLRVTVRDDGIGIPPERQASLFKPFQRAGQEAGPIEGTGIGLSITKRLAELMRGQVGFESSPGRGSAFWVEVPVHHARARSSAPPSGDEAPVRLSASNRVVLYVEDNPTNVVLMRELLARFEEIELLTAGTAEAGLELACARVPDVVIMDINLPGMDGVQALAALKAREETSAIPVVALTAAATENEQRRTTTAGFDRHLIKPIRISEFENVLRAVFAR